MKKEEKKLDENGLEILPDLNEGNDKPAEEKKKVKKVLKGRKQREVNLEIVKDLQVVPDVLETVQVPENFKTKITRSQIEIIKTQIAKGASDDELKMFLYVCERTGLDPFTKQVHLVPRWDSKLAIEVRGVIVGIDGLRAVAEKTGAYAGNTDPIFEGVKEITVKEGPKGQETVKKMQVPTKATVTVKKIVQGILCDFTASAAWDEYYPGDRQGIMWRKMPGNMLGKCAEAKALRKAFPNIMTGLYVAEEMHRAEPTEEEKQMHLFEQAKKGIINTNDKAKLVEYRSKFIDSDKYTDAQKAEIIEIIDRKTL